MSVQTVLAQQVRYKVVGKLPGYVTSSHWVMCYEPNDDGTIKVFYELVINKLSWGVTISLWSDVNTSNLTEIFKVKKEDTSLNEETTLMFVQEVIKDMKGIFPFIEYPCIETLDWKEISSKLIENLVC